MTLKKIMIVFVAVLVVSSVAFAQGRGQGRGWGQGARGVCVNYQSAKPVLVEGKIVKVETMENTRGRFDKGVHLVVKTKSGDTTVHMGPEAWMTKNGLTFKKGNAVKLKTYKGTLNNATAFVASEVTLGGKNVALRDKDGRPMWRRSLDPDQRRYKNRRRGRGRGWGKGQGRGWANCPRRTTN